MTAWNVYHHRNSIKLGKDGNFQRIHDYGNTEIFAPSDLGQVFPAEV
jgi:hypothetical protein